MTRRPRSLRRWLVVLAVVAVATWAAGWAAVDLILFEGELFR